VPALLIRNLAQVVSPASGPAPLRGREAAAIEALATESEQEDEDKEASSSGRGWGPFQVRVPAW